MADLMELADRFLGVKEEADTVNAELDALKKDLRAAVKALDEDDLPTGVDLDGGTFYLTGRRSGRGVTVSKSDEDPVQPLVAARFLAAVGPEQFFRFIRAADLTIPSKAFREDEWTRAQVAEEVTEIDLASSLGAAPKPRAWSVGTS